MGVRPESLSFARSGDSAIRGRAKLIEYAGSDSFVYVETDRGELVLARSHAPVVAREGEEVGSTFDARRARLFDKGGAVLATAPA